MRLQEAVAYSQDEISRLLTIEDLIEPLSAAFVDFEAGLVHAPVVVLHPTELSDMHVKCATMKGHEVFTIKLAGSSTPSLAESGAATTGFILVFDAYTSELIATLDDRQWITDVRTAATGALLARTCANKTVRTVGVIGSGKQAYLQTVALSLVRTFDKVVVWGRNSARVQTLVDRLHTTLTGVHVSSAPIDVVARTADVLITATSSTEPLVHPEWLHPGQHITAVGADDEFKCELHPGTLRRADRIIVDSLELTTRYGDVRYALQHSAFEVGSKTVELGSILAGKQIARRKEDAITIGKVVGLGFQDLAAVEHLLPLLIAARQLL